MDAVANPREAARALRERVQHSEHARVDLPGRDPVGLIAEQNATRLPDLVPVRIGRMLQSPFTYYRGTAGAMAHDLVAGIRTGTHVVACGDAHISNFGLYASPERQQIFDLNDFDEAGTAPWEWDVKRLAASVYIGARDAGLAESTCAEATVGAVRAYRNALAHLFELSAVERYYFQVSTKALAAKISDSDGKALRKTAKKARRRTSEQVISKIVATDESGTPRIVDQPPVTQHVQHATLDQLGVLLEQYRGWLREDLALLLSQFTLVDFVLRVVGVGSVGTRCYILLLHGPDDEPLVLQAKEAPPSVLHTYGGMPDGLPDGVPSPGTPSQGHRVVACQRILQAQSDPFLGCITGWAGDRTDRPRVDYYWRQFRDMKGSIDLDKLTTDQYLGYVSVCGALLARAHSQSPGGAVARWYLDGAEEFDAAVATWARRYADVCEADFAALEGAVASGRLDAEHGI